MTNELEDRLAATLHHRAEGEVDTPQLLGGAYRRGRTRSRRRVAASAFVAAGLAATAGMLASGPLRSGDRGGAAPAAAHESYPVPALALPGAPGAAQRPESVGSDVSMIHFGLASSPVQVREVRWSVAEGVERLDLNVDPKFEEQWASVELTRGAVSKPSPWEGPPPSPEAHRNVTVTGRPAVLTTYPQNDRRLSALQWKPVDGVTATIRAQHVTEADVLAIAENLRLDTASGCRLPARLASAPAGTQLLGCQIWFDAQHRGPAVCAQATLGDAHGLIEVGLLREGSYQFATPEPTLIVQPPDGSPPSPGVGDVETFTAKIDDTVTRLITVGAMPGQLYAIGQHGSTELDQIERGLTPAGDPADPRTWPERLLP